MSGFLNSWLHFWTFKGCASWIDVVQFQKSTSWYSLMGADIQMNFLNLTTVRSTAARACERTPWQRSMATCQLTKREKRKPTRRLKNRKTGRRTADRMRPAVADDTRTKRGKKGKTRRSSKKPDEKIENTHCQGEKGCWKMGRCGSSLRSFRPNNYKAVKLRSKRRDLLKTKRILKTKMVLSWKA